jgi:hypothetical protein
MGWLDSRRAKFTRQWGKGGCECKRASKPNNGAKYIFGELASAAGLAQ